MTNETVGTIRGYTTERPQCRGCHGWAPYTRGWRAPRNGARGRTSTSGSISLDPCGGVQQYRASVPI
eukprot:1836942-Karenia_brevis.AAC.1